LLLGCTLAEGELLQWLGVENLKGCGERGWWSKSAKRPSSLSCVAGSALATHLRQRQLLLAELAPRRSEFVLPLRVQRIKVWHLSKLPRRVLLVARRVHVALACELRANLEEGEGLGGDESGR